MTITPATIVAAFLFGAISAYFAHRRGRSPIRWFFIGFLFGALGIIAVFMSPKKKKPEIAIPVAPPLPLIEGPLDKFWYYLDPTHTQQGPISHSALTSAFHQGKISLTTYVWNEEMTEWKPLQEVVKG